ncbi:MAG: rRNA maturation RNase YbeY [Bacteroidetes bacterium]|nr:rRNA maturation RNase YbeY [Bacteroidota bacterium]
MPTVEITNTHPRKRIPRKQLLRLISIILSGERKSNSSWVSLVFVTRRTIRRINKSFLHHDYETDCISFPLHPPFDKTIQGEIYVSLDAAYDQSKIYRVSYFNEVLRLAAHGCLHLCGHEDLTERSKKDMIDRGERYLNRLN